MFLIWWNTCGSTLGAKTSLYAEDLQITNEEQLCISVCMFELGLKGYFQAILTPGPEEYELGSSCQLNGLAQIYLIEKYDFDPQHDVLPRPKFATSSS
ncbi:hypothetical protein H5410_040376 [Solanum commersonii]|uniref:Uncharacterized protein n=1 Tax=Solanum commersonii TaxID=4109 RepID=A0A9J5XSB8_SOLCO|nr:hypothetical protein H5410_040376 [Solanum commersonii]